ncbi:MAG: DUF2723 domain-containing protein [Candidatus Berkelbacteria bacterium]|nr:DUF2723 domain-containing protein [Candidatus Berkelbacteria bacterium]
MKAKITILCVFLFIFIIYLFTMLPGQAFHDAGEFQTIIHTVQIGHPTGFPTYIIFGKIFDIILPFVAPAWKANFLSLLYTLATLVFILLISINLTKNKLASILATLSAAFILPVFNYAGLADSHTLDRLFFFALFYIMLKISEKWGLWLWIIFALVFGLGLGNHLFLVYSIPGFLIWIVYLFFKKGIPLNWHPFVCGFLALILGLSVYILIPLKGFDGNKINAMYALNTYSGFMHHVMGSDFKNLMFAGGSSKIISQILAGFALFPKNLTVVSTIIGFAGLIYGLTKKFVPTTILLISFCAFLTFSTNYPTSDPSRYFANFYEIYVIWVAFGLTIIFFGISKVFIKDKYLKNLSIVVVAGLFVIFVPFSLLLRNFEKVDKSKDRRAENYATEIFDSVPPHSVIICWWNYYTPLWYQQSILGKRPDVDILNNGDFVTLAKEYYGTRPVFVVDQINGIEQYFNLDIFGPIYKLSPKTPHYQTNLEETN